MTSEQSALLVAFVAFLGVVLAPIVTGILNDQQDRRQKRHDYIQNLVTSLIEARSELQFYQKAGWEFSAALIKQNKSPGELSSLQKLNELRNSEEYQKMEIAYGKAYSIMLSVDIAEIREKADEVTNEKNNIDPSLKLAAIDFALKRLGKEYKFFNRPDEWRN